MGIVLVVTLVVTVLLIGAFVGGFQNATSAVQRQKQALSDVKPLKKELGLSFALMDTGGRVIGLRPSDRRLAIRNGSGREVNELGYEQLLDVSLTAETSSHTEGIAETTTPRTRQLLSASVGAAVAGPGGAFVGAVTSPQRHVSSSQTTENVDRLILEVRLMDEALPRFTLQSGDGVVPFEVEEAFKDMAARLANIVDGNAKAASSR
jgi:hypothetical protein